MPVFRYSLERWQPDRYEMVVMQRGPLTADEKNGSIRCAVRPRSATSPNVATIDLNEVAAEDQDKLLKNYKMPQLPWLIVRYPDHVDADGPAYSGPLQADAVRNLLDSPARTELARRLLKGESAVWLLLESGDAEEGRRRRGQAEDLAVRAGKDLKLPS